MRRSTPRPFAIIPIMFKISEIMTIIASNALKTSKRNMKFEANVFNMISIKKSVRNDVSILDKIDSSMPIMSAIVSQKRMKIVYKLINPILIVSKSVLSSIFKHVT